MDSRQWVPHTLLFVLGALAGGGAMLVRGSSDRELAASRSAFEAATQRQLARIERLCASRPADGTPDPTAVAAMVSAQLRDSEAGPERGPADAAAVRDAAAEDGKDSFEDAAEADGNWENVLSAQKLIDAALKARRWTPDDRLRMRALLSDMPAQQREQTLNSIAHHLNTGELTPTDDQPPL